MRTSPGDFILATSLPIADPSPDRGRQRRGGSNSYTPVPKGTPMLRRICPLIALALPLLAVPLPAADAQPIKVLIITGDHGHAWKETTPFLKDLLTKAGMAVDVTETPSKDLTAANLAKYDVLLLNYKETPRGAPDSRWSDANKAAFADAVRGR